MRWFSLEKANALIPKIAPLLEELLRKRRDLAIALLESQTILRGEASSATPSRLARAGSTLPAPRFGERKGEIVRLIHRVESFGCTVKDLDLGLVDFPALHDGKPVCLCWKFGEATISAWHETEEGFAQRKPLDRHIGH
ncbi:MAG: DUF2203 family protein [Vulcanimicrobiaceae bacterium]